MKSAVPPWPRSEPGALRQTGDAEDPLVGFHSFAAAEAVFV